MLQSHDKWHVSINGSLDFRTLRCFIVVTLVSNKLNLLSFFSLASWISYCFVVSFCTRSAFYPFYVFFFLPQMVCVDFVANKNVKEIQTRLIFQSQTNVETFKAKPLFSHECNRKSFNEAGTSFCIDDRKRTVYPQGLNLKAQLTVIFCKLKKGT